MSVRVELRGAVLHVIIDRPARRNAFDGDMLSAIAAAIDRAEAEEACRVLVLSGVGPAFCAGADLRWLAAQAMGGGEGNLSSARSMGGIFHRLSSCRKPTIARVHGAALGGGVGLASACDIVVASGGASFTLSEVRLGLVPAVISPFIVRRVGPQRARALFMLGGRVGAREAERIGLVDVLVDEDGLDAAIDGLCEDLFRGGPGAQALCKQLVDGVAFRDPGEVLPFTAAMIAEARATPEAAEGIAAFLGKRPASWIPGQAGVDSGEAPP